MRKKERLTVEVASRRENHSLPTTERQACGGILVGHAARQPERVAQCVVRALIRPEPRAADGYAQRCAVHRDDRAVPGCRFLAENDQFMPIG